MGETLVTRSGKTLSEYKLRKEHFLCRNTFIYGTSDSGKTYLTRDILHLLKDDIAIPYLISPTALDNKSYDGIIPFPCIFSKLHKIRDDFLELFWERQIASTTIYNKANDVNTLGALYRRIPHANIDTQISNLEINRNKLIRAVRKENTDEGKIKKEIEKVDEYRDKKLVEIYKTHIINNLHSLKNIQNQLSSDEKYCIEYINFSNKVLLILDDCAAEANEWATPSKKSKKCTMAEILYQGRHKGITTITILQDDKILKPPFRKNAHNSIFADAGCAIGFFTSTANAFQNDVKNEAKEYVNVIFDGTPNNYRKLCYIKNANPRFSHYTAEGHTNFRLGCAPLWKYCQIVEEKNADIDVSNTFASKFIL